MSAVLYLRSRRVRATVAALIALHILGLTLGAKELHVRSSDPTGSEAGVPWLIFTPLVMASLIALSVRSPLHDLDLTAARRMAGWRLGHVLILGATAAVSTATLTQALDGPTTTVSGLRNLAGFLGLTLLGGRFIAGWLAWLVPVVWALVAATLGSPSSQGIPWDFP